MIMNTHTSDAEVLRFEIVVNGEAYRSLVDGLRGNSVTPTVGSSLRSRVTAQVDLHLASRSYSVMSLGRHRLPSALAVKPGSRTHNSLTRLLARSVADKEHYEIKALIQEVIAATPYLSEQALSICKRDIEISPKAPASLKVASRLQTVQLLKQIAPTILLDLDDSPTLIIPESQTELLERASAILRSELQVLTPLSTITTGNIVNLRAKLYIPEIHDVTIDLFAHWGSYDDLAPAWQDEQVTISNSDSGTSIIQHRLDIPSTGNYGATLFAQVRGTSEQIWIGNPWHADARFWISHDDLALVRQRELAVEENEALALSSMLRAFEPGGSIEQACLEISHKTPHIALGALLKKAANISGSMNALQNITPSPHATLSASTRLNYGIGEVVFTSPEGPHAAAGGLAQVISGLPTELCRAGIPATIITPLYRYANGNKHGSAEQILRSGIKLGAELVKPLYVGSITVHVGPTYHAGTTCIRRNSSAIPIKVYLAQSGSLRIFLLTNASVFDRLYQPVFADEQIRRAIIISRATLETVATKQFGIRPSVIVSNDWMTACVPAFCALDPSYQGVEWLKSCKTVHMIHNGGADYHGKLPVNVHNEDLWPMFNLAPQDFFGFSDPYHHNLLNFSIAASRHVSGGVLTVSKPYAQQLISAGGGDGLEHVLASKSDKVFGISNGINRPEIDRYLSLLAGSSGAPFENLSELLTAKSSVKATLQKRYGLEQDLAAPLISFVGRIAEQKGVSLLSGFVAGTNRSTLEDLLIRHPKLQIIVAGPTTDGDRASDDLRSALEYLTWRYPGRVHALFEYVPHSTALEIIFGSTMFMMPSRFEPGGITQLEALAAGTLVIGRNVGGISATITNYDAAIPSGIGFLCNDYDPTAYANTCHWALEVTASRAAYEELVLSARSAKHSWSDRVETYRALLQQILLDTAQ